MQKTKANSRKTFYRIIKLVTKDSQAGLEKFYKEYGKLMFSVARSYCKSEDKVNSAINSVLIRIWKKAKDLNNVKNPEGFIYTVTMNCAKDEINERWNFELNENIVSDKDNYIEIEENDSFEYILSMLKENEREIFILRYRKGYNYREIAKILEKPLPTITTTYYRAIQKLKICAKDKNFE